MWAIIKKEFKSYFFSPVGYVFIGLFLIMFSIFFYTDVFYYQSTNFEYIFYSGATILTFITPILTMRTLAEERKTGTEQLLLTSPISITKNCFRKIYICRTYCSDNRTLHIYVFWNIKLFWCTTFNNSIGYIIRFFITCYELYIIWFTGIKYNRKSNSSRCYYNRIFYINLVFTKL